MTNEQALFFASVLRDDSYHEDSCANCSALDDTIWREFLEHVVSVLGREVEREAEEGEDPCL